MSKTLWNEGRVTGYSVWEIYLKYLATEAPDVTPATEKEFMSSMITMGNSMLLKVGTDNISGVHHRDIPLPASSKICAANTIIGSFFVGSGAVSSNDDSYTGWATRVTDYGPLIENNDTSSPTGDTIPPTDTSVGDLPDSIKVQIPEYLKIIDGVVLQPGTWTESEIQPPEKDFRPNINSLPIVRLSFKDSVERPFFLLLTGFSNKLVTQALSGHETALDTDSPSDGDFLGPWVFPWANKIVFSMPPSFAEYVGGTKIDIRTEDIAALYMYNTRYIWPYSGATEDVYPSQNDLQDVKRLNGIKAMVGHVSDNFINTYCVDYDTAIDACAYGHLATPDQPKLQMDYINQITQIYGATDAANYFKFFFYRTDASVDGVSQNGMFLPVDIRTNSIACGLDGQRVMNISHGFNLSASDITVSSVTVPRVNTDIMGSYWSNALPTDTTYSQPTNVEGVYAYENHPILHNVVKDIETFQKPYTGVPKAPVEYDGQWVQWFATVPMVTLCGGSAALSAMGVHSDYYGIDLQSFLQYAATQRDMSLPMSEITEDTVTNNDMYIYPATAIEAIADPNFTWVSNTQYATALFRAQMSAVDFFRMSEIRIYAVSTGTIGTDITDTYTDNSYHIWASTTKQDGKEIKAVSLIDDFGSPLPTAGAGGTIPTDYIKWSDLLEGLALNKKLDILGGAKTLKNSDDAYIQLGNGNRLYLSATEPTGVISEGSFGIGWGSGVYIYTSGAWSAIS